MQTVLVTGSSSGFGLSVARHFLDRGWRVVATMRQPRADLLPASDRLLVLPLDVADAASIARAVEAAGEIDVLVNNAGIGWLNALEGTPLETTRALFETNTFGTMATIQAVLPQFRRRRSGVIVNVTSSVTLKPIPLLSAYTASKAAVEAFSEVLALELAPFGIRVRVVQPGRAPETRFSDSARARIAAAGGIPAAYDDLVQATFAGWADPTAAVTTTEDVVEAVWRAATDPASPHRVPAGADAVALAAA